MSLKSVAQEKTSASVLMVNRTPAEDTDITGKKLTIEKVDYKIMPVIDSQTGRLLIDEETGEVKMGPRVYFVFKEIPEKFWRGGGEQVRMVEGWLEMPEINQNLETLNNMLVKEKVVLKLSMRKNRRGQNQWHADIL